MNLRELGRSAGERLLAAIDGRPSMGLKELPCSLVIRESSRPRRPDATVAAFAGSAARDDN
jgi:LacI family transcriptional regulator